MKDDCPSWVVTHLRQACSNPQKCAIWRVLLLNESWHWATAPQPCTTARTLGKGTGIRSAISGGYKVKAQCYIAENKAKHSCYHNKMSNAWLYCSQKVTPLLGPWSEFKYDLCCSKRRYNPCSWDHYHNKHNFPPKDSLTRRRKPSL